MTKQIFKHSKKLIVIGFNKWMSIILISSCADEGVELVLIGNKCEKNNNSEVQYD